MKKLHIVESEKTFLVVELFNHGGHYFSKVHRSFKNLSDATKYIAEDGMAANAMSATQGGGAPKVALPDILLRISKAAKGALGRRRRPNGV